MGNISHRLGNELPAGAIAEAIQGDAELTDSFARFSEHLESNGIDLKKEKIVLGSALKFNPRKERFRGPLRRRADELATRRYRDPFVIPKKV